MPNWSRSVKIAFATLALLAFDRSAWMPSGWEDADGDCQDERQEILIRDSILPPTFETPRRGCRVRTGLWFDPYAGHFHTDPRELDIDHMIPLAYADEHGTGWTAERRRAFAQDPANLVAVSARENRRKGAKGPAEYLPPYKARRCEYVEAWYGVLAAYPEITLPAVDGVALEGACP